MVDRRKTHGDFRVGANYTQSVETLMRAMPNWDKLTPSMKEALHMIQHKIHRILTGEFDRLEHWEDIPGYGNIIVQILKGEYGDVRMGDSPGDDRHIGGTEIDRPSGG